MSDQRRIVTILFADVAGSTALGEAHDPEDMRTLLSRYYTAAREVIGAHGGTVEKFIGDAVMAIFGLPRAHGDDAERALAAAFELRARLQADAALGLIELRFGVTTGEVVASQDVSRGDFLVTGDAVNLAARLQQAAGIWEILCDERTVRAVGDRFITQAPRELELRGKALPVRGYPVLRRAGASTGRVLPMVGRASDLEQLQLAARRSFTENRPQLVSIIAPAGAGKSRLVEEFLARLPQADGAPLVAVAQCLPYGQRLTFWPLRAVLQAFVGGDKEESSPGGLEARLAGWLKACGTAEPEWVAQQLASTVGAAEIAQPDSVAMFNAWRSAVKAAASGGPVVIVFEDLHWSSDTLLDLVEHVMQPWAELPVLMIALTRPELLDRRPAWGGGRRNYISITLEPLDDAATGILVRHLLSNAFDDVVQGIVARAEGNPFYAGELVRALLEQAIDPTDRAQVEKALAQLPDTVYATVLARLDLLPAGERVVLQLGAVLGRSFDVDLVAALGGLAEADVRQACIGLLERDLLRVAATTYTFRHILIREVAYKTLPRSERARLHGGAATLLEARAAGREEAFAELVAFHYREAATLAGAAAAPQLRQGAANWLMRAAEAALAGAATVEALGHLAAAIEFAAPEQLPELYERLGASTQSGSAADLPLRKALQLSEEAGRPVDDQLRILARLLMSTTRMQGSVATRMSEAEMAGLRRRGRDLLARADPEGAAAARFLAADSCYPFWSTTEVSEAEYAAAEADARRAAAIAERLGDDNLLSAALDGLTSVYNDRGCFAKGLEVSRQRVAMGRRLVANERIDAYSMVTWACLALGDLAAAERASAEGLAQVQPGLEPGWTLHLVAWRIYGLNLMGQWDRAAALGLRARQLWEEAGRETAGFALRGFAAALEIAEARAETAQAAELRYAAEAILAQFEPLKDVKGGFYRRWRPLIQFDRAAIEAAFAEWEHCWSVPDSLERLLAALTDHGWPLPASSVAAPLAWSIEQGLKPLEMQLRRSIGLVQQDPSELRRAAAIAAAIGALPTLARANYEAARLTDDVAGMEGAIAALETLGDRAQIRRYQG